jgi:hypothetical protein
MDEWIAGHGPFFKHSFHLPLRAAVLILDTPVPGDSGSQAFVEVVTCYTSDPREAVDVRKSEAKLRAQVGSFGGVEVLGAGTVFQGLCPSAEPMI